jgi:hypothetical protein
MVRTRIQLTEEQFAALRKRAAAEDRSMAYSGRVSELGSAGPRKSTSPRGKSLSQIGTSLISGTAGSASPN